MSLPDDYSDAHSRHWEDAELLNTNSRLANADHLYGLSAECGLKALLELANQPIVSPYRTHVEKLWQEFRTFSAGRQGAMNLSGLPQGNPFVDWMVDDRYANRNHFTPARVAPHRIAASQIRFMVQNAIQSGHP